MIPRSPLWLCLFVVAGTATGFSVLAFRTVPAVVQSARQGRELKRELEGLTRALANADLDSLKTDSLVSREARAAEESAKQLAERLAQSEVGVPSTSEASKIQWAAEIAEKTGWPRSRIESWMPAASIPAEVAAIQMVTVRDLALAAAEAGVSTVIFVVFPQDKPDSRGELFGEWMPTIPVSLEYRATYAAHRVFLGGLLARRDRGPLYTIDRLDISGDSDPGHRGSNKPGASSKAESVKPTTQGPPLLDAKLVLRRIVASPK